MKSICRLSPALIFSLLTISIALSAQEKVKFGKPALTDLEMKTYPLDTSAQAVILFDKGYFRSSDFAFTRHVRVKILKKGGTAVANFTIKAPSKSSIDGYTYNLESGNIVTTKLEKANVYEERIVDNFELYKVFFPNVKEGSVVDLRYSYWGLPSEWRFQELVPVVYNELTLEQSQYIVFKKIMFGNARVEAKSDIKWVARDVPAITVEPYMNHYSNYVTKFKIDIERIQYREFSTTWEKVGERLMEFSDFGGILREAGFLNEKARELKQGDGSTMDKIRKAHQYIRETITWNEITSLYASTTIRENFKKNHTGNSADINLLLIALLNKMDIKALPMILSTRDNGLINPAIASISGPNYVMGYVKDGESEILLDATSPHFVPGVVPLNCRNFSGWVILDGGRGFWVDLSKGMANVQRRYINITRDADHQYHAEVSDSFEGYGYLDWIKEFEASGSEQEYSRQLIAKSAHEGLDECALKSINKADLKSTILKKINLSATDKVQDLGDQMIINPFVLSEFENPFKSESREFPVDFISPKKNSVIITFQIPKDYVLRKVPEPLIMSLEKGGAKFSYRCVLNNNILNIRCDLQIENQVFDQSEYASLRNFFTHINRKVSEALELEKKI